MLELENGSDPDTVLIDIKEFRKAGYLQEVNRLFFHPLGLALEVMIDMETGEESLVGVLDYRQDPEGVAFVDSVIDIEKVKRIEQELLMRSACRLANLGWVIQPPE